MPNWVKVAKAGQIAEGEALGVTAEGKEIALYLVNGAYRATANICSHAYALLSDGFLDEYQIECPLHAARFDIRTGRALGGPAMKDIKVYPIRHNGDDILVDLG